MNKPLHLTIYILFLIFSFEAYSWSISSEANCKILPLASAVTFKPGEKIKIQFEFQQSVQADLTTGGIPEFDTYNQIVTVIRPGVGEYTSSEKARPGNYTFSLIAANTKKQIYQTCLLKLHVLPAISLITDRNRYHDSGEYLMGGGWGPHLRSVLYGKNGTKWFVNEFRGPSTLINPGLEYNRYDAALGWKRHYSTDQAYPFNGASPVIQQSMAHVSDGETIYSYGVDYYSRTHKLIECKFDIRGQSIKSPVAPTCNSISNSATNEYSNYVGAAIVPEGKLAWFTSNLSPNNRLGMGSFSYLFHDGNSWSNAKVVGLGIYDQLNYVRSVNTGKGIQVIAGELEHGHHGVSGPASAKSFMGSRYSTAIGVIDYKSGAPAKIYRISYKGAYREGGTVVVEDLHYDPASNRVHFIVKLFGAPIGDRFAKDKSKLPDCVAYDTVEKKYKGKTYGQLTSQEHSELDEAGSKCVSAVKKNQMTLYGFVPTLAYGSVRLEDLIAGTTMDSISDNGSTLDGKIEVFPQPEFSNSVVGRFLYDRKTSNLNFVFTKYENKGYKLKTYTFDQASLRNPLLFSNAKTVRTLDLDEVEPTGDLKRYGPAAIYVSNPSYTKENYLSSELDIAITGSGYTYKDKTRSDGRIYHLILPR